MKNIIYGLLSGFPGGLAIAMFLGGQWMVAYLLLSLSISLFLMLAFFEKPRKSDGYKAYALYIGASLIFGLLWPISVPFLIYTLFN